MSTRRDRAVLFVLLLGQLILLTLQIPDPASDRSSLAALGLRLVAPFARLVDAAGRTTESLADWSASRQRLRRENQQLSGRLAELELELLRLRGVEGELALLAETSGYARQLLRPQVVADVIHADYTSVLRHLVLYTGEVELEVNQPVTAADGLVGRVVRVAGPYAQVQLTTDRAAAVAAMVVRTRRQGVVRGEEGGRLSLDYLTQHADVVVGDRVVTAGVDGVYPRGLPIGSVASVKKTDGLFLRIELTPAVDLGRLVQVVVLEGGEPTGLER